MIEWAEEHSKDMSDRADLESFIEKGDLLDVAEGLRKRLGESDFRKFMVEVFCNPDIEPVEAHELLTELPLSAVLTSNYDTLAEDAYEKAEGESPDYNRVNLIDSAVYFQHIEIIATKCLLQFGNI